MKIFKNSFSFQKYCLSLKKNNIKIGFIPTMGCLHEGHLSLIKKSKNKCDHTIVSIFVNPLQFAPDEDFIIYPRPWKKDIVLCRELSVDCLFIPNENSFYNKNLSVKITEDLVSKNFCGKYRGGHFDGVLTVVLKLLNLSMADILFLGQKDYQQCVVVKKMISDMNIPVKVNIGSTVREKTGLALSSRNKYLNKIQKQEASKIYKILYEAKRKYQNNKNSFNINSIKKIITKKINDIKGFRLQYLEVADRDSLEVNKNKINNPVILVAGYFGKTRLIDNIIL